MTKAIKSHASFNKMIRSALLPAFLPDKDGNYPIAHQYYSGPASQYAIFSNGTNVPEIFGSGSNRVVRGYGYVDYFSKTDDSGATGKVGEIADALNAAAGITVTQVSDVGRDAEGWYHTEFSVTLTAFVEPEPGDDDG